MNERADRLYELLPSVYRQRDAELGQPLRALLRVVAEQVNVVEDDIAQLYENWFIETCQDWVVPYIADLIGYQQVHEAGEPGSAATAVGALRNRILIPRREVSHTIRYRRRKGTLAALEMLARDVAGWPARAVEFYQLLGVAQNLNFLHLDRGRALDLREGDALDLLNGPFERTAHTVDVRSLNSHRTVGRYDIPNVGLFVWRLQAYSVTKAPAYRLERRRKYSDTNRYTFSLLSNDTQLYTLPVSEPEPTHIADEMNVPAPIRRRAFDDRTADYYGAGKSLMIWVGDLHSPVPLENIVSADLSGWAYRPQGAQVAVDPQLGRLALSDEHADTDVWVSYYYGFSADVGGGEYERELLPPGPRRRVYRVSQQSDATGDVYRSITGALNAWDGDRRLHPDAIIEIDDSEAYTEQLDITLELGERLEIRAAVGARPVIRLYDQHVSQGDALTVTGVRGHDDAKNLPHFTIDGLLVTGRGLQIRDGLDEVTIRHCTLVPGWAIGHDCEPENEMDPSLELINTTAELTIDHSIVGTILVDQNEVATDPLSVSVNDSILDAVRPEYEALGVSEAGHAVAHVRLTIARTTVLGQVSVHRIELGENSIFYGRVVVARTQKGCLRFCYVPAESRTPRRYQCQPDGVTAGLVDEDLIALARMRVRPRFNSMRYGTPDYCQLARTCADEIKRGADDESEMGVFHDLFQPQREANLRARLDEHTPASTNAGIILVN